MSEILFQYEKINPATWVYLSSLLMIGLFFQFNRFWSVRNLDLVLLILLTPGLLMVNQARQIKNITPPPASLTTDATDADPELAMSADAAETPLTPAESDFAALRQLMYFGYVWL